MNVHGLNNGHAWTWVDTETRKPVLSAGFLPIVPGVAETWAIVSPVRFSVLTLRTLLHDVYRFHTEMAGRHGIVRFQCLVESDHPGAERLAKKLGYQYEGTLRDWGYELVSKHRYAWLARYHL